MLMHRLHVFRNITRWPDMQEETDCRRMVSVYGFQERGDAKGCHLRSQSYIYGRQSKGQIPFIPERIRLNTRNGIFFDM
jgi:hypothetical protein